MLYTSTAVATDDMFKLPVGNGWICALAEEATESKGGHFAKLKWFSIAKITIL